MKEISEFNIMLILIQQKTPQRYNRLNANPPETAIKLRPKP